VTPTTIHDVPVEDITAILLNDGWHTGKVLITSSEPVQAMPRHYVHVQSSAAYPSEISAPLHLVIAVRSRPQ
jgi:hypothetical protein